MNFVTITILVAGNCNLLTATVVLWRCRRQKLREKPFHFLILFASIICCSAMLCKKVFEDTEKNPAVKLSTAAFLNFFGFITNWCWVGFWTKMTLSVIFPLQNITPRRYGVGLLALATFDFFCEAVRALLPFSSYHSRVRINLEKIFDWNDVITACFVPQFIVIVVNVFLTFFASRDLMNVISKKSLSSVFVPSINDQPTETCDNRSENCPSVKRVSSRQAVKIVTNDKNGKRRQKLLKFSISLCLQLFLLISTTLYSIIGKQNSRKHGRHPLLLLAVDIIYASSFSVTGLLCLLLIWVKRTSNIQKQALLGASSFANLNKSFNDFPSGSNRHGSRRGAISSQGKLQISESSHLLSSLDAHSGAKIRRNAMKNNKYSSADVYMSPSDYSLAALDVSFRKTSKCSVNPSEMSRSEYSSTLTTSMMSRRSICSITIQAPSPASSCSASDIELSVFATSESDCSISAHAHLLQMSQPLEFAAKV